MHIFMLTRLDTVPITIDRLSRLLLIACVLHSILDYIEEDERTDWIERRRRREGLSDRGKDKGRELHMMREGNTGTEGLTSEWEGYDREGDIIRVKREREREREIPLTSYGH